MFEDIDKGGYNTLDELDNLLFKTRRHFDSDLIREHFKYNNLEEMLESLDNTKNTYINGVKVSLIKSGLTYLENEIKQMPKDEIRGRRPDEIVNFV